MDLNMKIKLPYVCAEKMPSGNLRYRFQRHGKKITLSGEPGSPEFLQSYNAARDGVAQIEQEAARGITKGSIAWLIRLFLKDVERRVETNLTSPLTLKGHRHHLNALREEHGAKSAEMPRAKLIVFLDQFTKTPGARDNRRKSISAMYQWAIERDYVSCENPAAKIKRINTKTTGHHTWTLDEVQAYFKTHKPGTTAHRVMVLEICTAARRDDLRLLGRHNEFQKDGRTWLRWTQSKAPHARVEIPMLPMLAAEIKGHANGVYILNSKGAPYTHGSIGTMFRKWADRAGVNGSLHGVRKGLSSILPELGASSYELDVLLGHSMGSRETQIYVQGARRSELALTLSEKMERIKI